jgi:SAM-dependent methyltransferase
MGREAWLAGEPYERYIGRWSREVAKEFVRWLAVPAGGRWLDVGCGTGALTAAIVTAAQPRHVLGLDPSPGFLPTARAGTPGPVSFAVADARALPLRDGCCDAVASGLALNFVPDAARAVAEFARVTRRGGTVAAYVWDYAGGMGMLRRFWDAAASLDPAAAALDEGRCFPLCHPEPLRRLWSDADISNVNIREIDIRTVFAGFDDYWQPFLGGQGPAPGYVAALPARSRQALRDLLRARLPGTPISLTARTWAIRGVR